nr:MAG TPA_asm: hypothetical protein [Caudoviricetes sp.]
MKLSLHRRIANCVWLVTFTVISRPTVGYYSL